MKQDGPVGWLEELGSAYLVCDAAHPLISNGTLTEETLLYNIPPAKLGEVIAAYNALNLKPLSSNEPLENLSGGQKVMLMIILALSSPARKIAFINIGQALDPEHAAAMETLLDSAQAGKAEIRRMEA